MKAVILAGGEGTRLRPLTYVANKNLLPLYDKPVISHTMEKLVAAGMKEIMIISSPHHIDQFKSLLGTGEGCSISYGIQKEAKGIAHGLYVAREFVGTDDCLFWLGDNVIEDDIKNLIKGFSKGAKIFLKKVSDPERFGVASVDKDLNVTDIVEKPSKPKTDLAVVGLYLYDSTVWKKIERQKPSARGEYEVTDLNIEYMKEGKLKAALLKEAWFDIGSFESLFQASAYAREKALKAKKK